MNKTKQVKRFRVRVGKDYCSLDKRYHELGVVIPGATLESAHTFNSRVAASNAIQRGYEARNLARQSMHDGWSMLKPLFFEGAAEVEEFLVDEV